MALPAASLNSLKGFGMLVLGTAVAIAILSSTNIGRQIQTALNGAAASIPV